MTAIAPDDDAYDLVRVTHQHLELLRGWVQEPHVREWWGDPAVQIGLIAGDIGEPRMGCYIVRFEGRPFAYVQWWDTQAYETFLDQPAGSLGIDPFIGIKAMTGRGHGARLVRFFADRLLGGGAPRVLIDPDPDNARAIRTYTKAGFRTLGPRDTAQGRVLLMALDNPMTKANADR